MDPDLRNFYVSWAQINCAQCWHVDYLADYDLWIPISWFGQSFAGYLGFHVAQRNWGVQLLDHGSFDKNSIIIQIPGFSTTGLYEPDYDVYGNVSYESFTLSFLDYTSINKYVDPPTDPPTEEEPMFFAYNLPRLKYKIRRSYWTGAPRRRRNL
jgi:hypothetical protein